jgi:cytochrome c556
MNRAAVAGVLLSFVAVTGAQPPTPTAEQRPLVTIKEVMEMTITPATNVLWAAPERPTDEEWAALEQASITVLVAADFVARGGAGQHDVEWAGNPAWVAFNAVMVQAGLDALKASRARDRDALAAAGDVLYPPCEGCHLQFNPGVAPAQ